MNSKLSGSFSHIRPCKVMVVGDFLLDTYTMGKVNRISPEAPVAVVRVKETEHRPGGAGNVVLNLVSLGAEVVAVGRVGPDVAGGFLTKALEAEDVHIEGIFTEPDYLTPTKNRIIADNQQIVRVDYETIVSISASLEKQVAASFPKLLKGVAVVAISDYGKGFLTPTLLQELIKQAKSLNIPIIADPKGSDFSKYAGVTLLKPNFSEAIVAAGLGSDAPLEKMAAKILSTSQAEVLMITRSEAGISLFFRDGSRQDYPVRVREVKDVTGAGDTVLAMVTCALGNRLPYSFACQMANVAAGIAIERFGCARVSLSDLAKRLLEEDVKNKVFDEEHLFALQSVLNDQPFAVLAIEGGEALTPAIFNNIHLLSNRFSGDLLVYVKDLHPQQDFINMLAALHDVSFIILCQKSLKRLCEAIHPTEVYSIEKGILKKIDQMSSLMAEMV